MTSNKEFISQTKETLAKKGASKAPQFYSKDGSFRKLLGIKEGKMVFQSIHKKANFRLMQKLNLNTEVSK
jgi:hypothetical protein